ncbi:hypothetical protein [Rhodosalinus sp. 5P4]|uniref:hypothetical protein n=1 Tax=Rhodosalinus sp. 5P4 TaxID=3239196 RepID=UPI0035267210
MKRSTLAATFVATTLCLGAPLQADHGNPWAGEDDTVLSKYHDANQARSADTPGEDEMRGALARNANGKLDADGSGRGGGGGGHGGSGNGGGDGGHGGGGHGGGGHGGGNGNGGHGGGNGAGSRR